MKWPEERGRRDRRDEQEHRSRDAHEPQAAVGAHRHLRRLRLDRCDHGGRGGGHLHRRRRPEHRAVAHHGHAALHRVLQVEGELAVLAGGDQLEQVDQVGAEQLRGLGGQPARQVGVAQDRHPVVGDDLGVGDRAGDVAAVGRRHVDHDRAGLHRRHHGLGDQPRRRAPRDQRGGDDDVDVGGLLGVQLGGLRVEVGAGLLRVAVGRRTGLLDVDAQELGPHRLDLLTDLGAGVERTHDRTQRVGGADRGQPGHPGTHDQHLGRRHLARGGDLTGEERPELVRGLDHRAVATDVRHRRQHVQRLRPRDARHGIHRQRGHPTRGQRGRPGPGSAPAPAATPRPGPAAAARSRPRTVR